MSQATVRCNNLGDMPRETPDQRAAIYIELIKMIDEGYRFWTCNVVFSLEQEASGATLERDFPELWQLRPTKNELGYIGFSISEKENEAWGGADKQEMLRRRRIYLAAINLIKQST